MRNSEPEWWINVRGAGLLFYGFFMAYVLVFIVAIVGLVIYVPPALLSKSNWFLQLNSWLGKPLILIVSVVWACFVGYISYKLYRGVCWVGRLWGGKNG